MPGNIFGGGGMFGKPLKVSQPFAGQQQGTTAPLGGPQGAQATQGGLGVVPPTPTAGIPKGHAMTPNGPVPLGAKKDCPVCRG